MKTPISIHRLLLQSWVVLSTAAAPLLAQQDDVAQAAGNGAGSAGGLAKAAEKSRGGLSVIADEAAFNQLEEPHAKPLETFSQRLHQIGQKQVAPLQHSFDAAAAATGDSQRRDALVDAFVRQKALELALKDAAAEFSPGEAQLRLVRQTALLLSRQTHNVRLTSELAQSASEPTGSTLRRVTIAGVEQAALEQEIRLLARTVTRTPADWPDGSPAESANAVREKINDSGLLSAAERATGSTRQALLTDAVTDQQAIETRLSALLDATLEAAPMELVVADAKKILAEITADERQLRTATSEESTDNPTLAERQKRIEERTEVLQRLIARVNPEAAGNIAQAAKQMGKAAGGLAPGANPGGAVPAESEALALLGKAAGMMPGAGPGKGPGQGQGEDGEDGGGEGGSGGRGEMDGADDGDDPERSRNSAEKSAALAVGKLVAKEREAFARPDDEGSLPEYSALVEQYLRSLTEPPASP